MMRWLLVVALLGLGAVPVGAATWTCAERTEIVTTTLVLVRCFATGTYTTGGDSFSDFRADLCNSQARIPVNGVASTAMSGAPGQSYVTFFDRSTDQVMLFTAANATGNQFALVELNGGTAIDGAVFTALVNCR